MRKKVLDTRFEKRERADDVVRNIDNLVRNVRSLVEPLQNRAVSWDLSGSFPIDDLADLSGIGLFRAVVPKRFGGLGLGTEPIGSRGLLSLMRLIGRANLALGRLLEANIHALCLVFRYGDDLLQEAAACDACSGRLIGLWITDPADGRLRVDHDGTLLGTKDFCSGAGHITRAVVTASDDAGAIRLVYARLEFDVTAKPMAGGLSGMRAATTGQVIFNHAAGTAFGQLGDYQREPDRSRGTWRASAVALGGLDALTDQLQWQLAGRACANDPHQQALVMQAMVAAETARLWVAEAGTRAESADADPDESAAYVGMARLATERACLDTIELTQRSLGAAALLKANPVERICRDLTTYLRQLSADAVSAQSGIQSLRHISR